MLSRGLTIHSSRSRFAVRLNSGVRPRGPMRLLNYEKWESARLKGGKAFVRWFAFRIGLFNAFLMSLGYVWTGYRLYSTGVLTSDAVIRVSVAVAAVLFIVGPAVFWLCGELSWRATERLYRRHIEKQKHVAAV